LWWDLEAGWVVGTTGDLTRDIGASTVAALLRASARPGWPRLKACRGADCRWVFIDGSRTTSRRWCDMAACGNRAKGETFRARHRMNAARKSWPAGQESSVTTRRGQPG
jgi:predicted RNA-binding Zn ribbon-like protein